MEDIRELIFNTILSEPQDEINKELELLSLKLQKLLPDPSIGPMERLERLSRVIPNSYQIGQHHRTARVKLLELHRRLDELLPEQNISYSEKIDILVSKINALVPEETDRLCQKLQFIGDNRLRDNGSVPYVNWSLDDLDLQRVVEDKRNKKINPNKYNYIGKCKE